MGRAFRAYLVFVLLATGAFTLVDRFFAWANPSADTYRALTHLLTYLLLLPVAFMAAIWLTGGKR